MQTYVDLALAPTSQDDSAVKSPVKKRGKFEETDSDWSDVEYGEDDIFKRTKILL